MGAGLGPPSEHPAARVMLKAYGGLWVRQTDGDKGSVSNSEDNLWHRDGRGLGCRPWGGSGWKHRSVPGLLLLGALLCWSPWVTEDRSGEEGGL